MSALKELLDRVNAATGPMTTREVEECIRLSPWYADRPSHDPIWNDFCKALYGSVDAALALVERVLPGTAIGNCSYWPMLAGGESDDNRHANVTLIRTKDGWGIPSSSSRGSASTLPLAILSALLSALIARAGQ